MEILEFMSRGSGVIVTGGVNLKTAEVVFPASEKICPLPDLPKSVKEHTQDGLVLCGAKEDKTSCFTLSENGWTKSHDLIKERFNHVSWQTEEGVLLMGGASIPDSTELGERITRTSPSVTQNQLSLTGQRKNSSVLSIQ